MAHTDACKIQATQFMKKLVDTGMSVVKASEVTEKESDGIPAETLRSWWYQINKEVAAKTVENSTPHPTHDNSSETPDNQVAEVKHGGKREGAGAPPKYEKVPEPKPKYEFTNAMQIATFVISHLERIMADDPNRSAALDKVSKWIIDNL